MLFSREDYEILIDQVIEKYNSCVDILHKEVLIRRTAIKLNDIRCKATEATYAVLCARLYANNYEDLRRDFAKAVLLDSAGVVDREEALRVFWWCLADCLKIDASLILNEIDRLSQIKR